MSPTPARGPRSRRNAPTRAAPRQADAASDAVDASPPRTAERLLMLLKLRGPQTAAQLAAHLDVSTMAVRQHLDALLREGDVAWEDHGGKVGRPARHWMLTTHSRDRFPDTHAELTVRLIDSVRDALGASALDAVVAHHQAQTEARYRKAIPARAQVGERVQILARLRDEEGYMATVERGDDGSWLLVENHCPICAAAEHCQGFCDGELRTFRNALGDAVSVQREEHLLRGARRCAYRIRTGATDAGQGDASPPRKARTGTTARTPARKSTAARTRRGRRTD
jgi:predicted ArsR family transcriptional regulator